jgi:hypothetical protein
MDRWKDGRINGLTDRWVQRRMERQKDRHIDRHIDSYRGCSNLCMRA